MQINATNEKGPPKYEEVQLAPAADISIVWAAPFGSTSDTDKILRINVEGYIHLTEPLPQRGRIVICSPKRLPLGQHQLGLEPISAEEMDKIVIEKLSEEPIDKLRRNFKVQIGEGQTKRAALAEFFRKFQNEGPSLCFRPRPLLSREQLEHVLRYWDWDELLDDFFLETCEKDPDLQAIYVSHLTDAPRSLPPERYQQYSPHDCQIKSTKFGSSMLALKIADERRFERLTSARLFGYATADEIWQGELDGCEGPVYMDNARVEEGIVDYILGLMELGRAAVGTGRATLRISTKASFHIIENLAEEDNPIWKFQEIAQRYFKNPEGAGSRMGIVYVNPRARSVIKRRRKVGQLDNGAIDCNRLIVREAIEACRGRIDEVWSAHAVQEWLDRRAGYGEEIEQAVLNAGMLAEVKTFWRTHISDGYRHTKGAALHAAILESIPELYFDQISIEELLKRAENWLNRYKLMNLQSIRLFAEIGLTEAELTKRYVDEIEHPSYIRAIAYSAAMMLRQLDETYRRLAHPLESLKPYFEGLPNELKARLGPRYSTWSGVSQAVKNLEVTNRHLAILGLQLIETEGVLFFRFTSDRLSHYPIHLESVRSVSSVTSVSETSGLGLAVTPITPITPVTPTANKGDGPVEEKAGGKPELSQNEKVRIVSEIIAELEREHDYGAPRGGVVKHARERGVPDPFTVEFIRRELESGHLYEPKPGFIKRTGR